VGNVALKKILSGVFLTSIVTASTLAPLYFTWPTYFDIGLWIALVIFLFELWLIAGIIVQTEKDFSYEFNPPRVVVEISKFIFITGITSFFLACGLLMIGVVWGAWQDRYVIIQFLGFIFLLVFNVMLIWSSIYQMFKRRS
jgi:hypothetical protein